MFEHCDLSAPGKVVAGNRNSDKYNYHDCECGKHDCLARFVCCVSNACMIRHVDTFRNSVRAFIYRFIKRSQYGSNRRFYRNTGTLCPYVEGKIGPKKARRKSFLGPGVDKCRNVAVCFNRQQRRTKRNGANMPRKFKTAKDALFIGVYSEGLSYCDRRREKSGDYVRVAFLSFRTLELRIYPEMRKDMRDLVERNAAEVQARRGETYEISACGQTTLLGWGLPKND